MVRTQIGSLKINMIYQTLYKRAKTGKILSYNIRVEDNETPQIR